MVVNFSIPATLSEYRASENPLFSYARLKIFYVGMTEDKRLFTKSFSDELLKSLPLVPVVAYYNKEKEDFEGHYSTQYIYGVVPESAEIEYVEEGNKTFAVCDVILYTGREDETGEIAQKIVGKKHSLELNPKNTTYEINKDADGNIQNIEFKTGTLLGLSVLGDDEKPAFEGSEFFSFVYNDFVRVFSQFEKVEEESTIIETEEAKNEQRGETMQDKIFESAMEFIKRSYAEKAQLLIQAVSESLGYDYFYLPQIFEDTVIVSYYDEDTGEIKDKRYSYSTDEEGNVVFGEGEDVLVRYLTEVEIKSLDSALSGYKAQEEDLEDQDNLEGLDENTEELTEETNVVEEENFDSEEEKNEEEQGDFLGTSDTNEETGNAEEQEQEFEVVSETTEEADQIDRTSLDNSEREELEAFRRAKKLAYVETFESTLDTEFLNSLKEEIDKYTFEELEVLLSKKFTEVNIKKIKTGTQKQTQKINAFYYENTNLENSARTRTEILQELVEKYK